MTATDIIKVITPVANNIGQALADKLNDAIDWLIPANNDK